MSADLAAQLTGLSRLLRVMRQQPATPEIPVPPAAVNVLALIVEAHPCRSKDLVDRSGLEPSTISRAVRALTEHGLVARTLDPDDGRAVALSATAAGHQVLERAAARMDSVVAAAVEGWSEADLAAFTPLLTRFVADLAGSAYSTRSNSAARPWPPPMHIVSSASRAPRRSSS